MEKLLPIKFFEKRKKDEQLTEAGGSKIPPKWVLQGDALTQHAQQLSGSMAKVSASFAAHNQEEHELPMVMTTTITEDALAKTHRKAVVDLLNSDNSANVIGIEPDRADEEASSSEPDSTATGTDQSNESKETRRLMSIVASDQLISNINRALQDTQGSAKLISSIEDIRPFEAIRGAYNPENKAYRVVLIDYQDKHRNQLAQTLFKNQCEMHGVPIEKETRYSSDMRLYRVSLDSLDEMEMVRGFEGVLFVEEAIPIRASLDTLDDSIIPAVKAPEEGKEYPVVGVLDSGIEKNNYLSPWLLSESEEYYEKGLQNKSHGSMVASILEYSDELNGTGYTATDGVMMLEAVVAPDPRKEVFYPDDLIDDVRNAIEKHKDIKIWTMSVGTTEACSSATFSEYGIALDNIADENDVLIIKSVGNSTAFMHGGSNERVAKMADTVRALVVGSIANDKGQYDLAEKDMPSPFTRKGPGPAYIIKPDLVAYGGNAGVRSDGKMSQTGVKAIAASGTLAEAAGTSFSTPWIARIAAELNYLLDGEFDPVLIKALMIHNAGYPAGDRMKQDILQVTE